MWLLPPVAQNSNYLAANFIAVDSIASKDIQLLLPISKQLISLKLANTKCADETLGELGRLTTLTRLSLENTGITDKIFSQLAKLTSLQYLNVSGTTTTANGLKQLAALKQLRNLYLYKNIMTADEFIALKKLLPATAIDTGGYKVPILASDTTVFKQSTQY